jgi:hypothetical protein
MRKALGLSVFMGYLHTPTDIRENRVVRHLKVLYEKNRIHPICENYVK